MVKKKVIIVSIISAFVTILAVIFIIKLVGIVKVNNNIKLGNRYYQQGRYRESVIVFEMAVKGDKKKLDGRLGLFKAYIAIGEKKKGEILLIETIEIIPKKKEPYLYLAKFYGEEKRPKDALAILKKAWENTEENNVKLILNRCTAQPGIIVAILSDELSKNIGNKLVTLLSSPVITSPTNGDIFGKEDIKVTWNGIVDAGNYYVSVRDITSGKKIVDDINVKKSTSYIIASSKFVNEHQYCISVGVKYSNGNERWNEKVCVLVSSTKVKNISLNASPVIISPTLGQVCDKDDINVEWKGVEGATAYIISILDVTIGDQLVNNYNVGLEKSYRLLGALITEGHSYRIAICAKGNSGEEKWTEIAISISGSTNIAQINDITSPVITLPANGRTYDRNDINIAWNAVRGTSEYIVNVNDISANKVIVDKRSSGTELFYTIPSKMLTEAHRYSISVGAKASNGYIKWSEITITISKAKVTLLPPTITSPVDGGTYKKDNVVVTWNAVEGAAEYILSIQDTNNVQIINNFSTGTKRSYTIEASKIIEGHSYIVEVVAKDSSGNIKASKITFNIIVSTPIEKLVITSPINGAFYSKTDVLISWTKVSSAASYSISVTEDTSREIAKDLNLNLKNEYTLTSDLILEGHKYKITVKALDSEGKQLSQDETAITIVDKNGKH